MKINFPKNLTKISPKTYWKEILAFFVILLAIVFFRSERNELRLIIPQLKAANGAWVLAGVMVTVSYILLQGIMYIKSFRAIGLHLGLTDAVELFLKRNFLSVFLPAGGISSLAYTTSQLRKKNLNATQIHQAGAIYAFVGLLTVFIIGIPVIIYTLWDNHNFGNAWVSLVALGVLLGAVYFIIWSFREKKFLYAYFSRKFPSLVFRIDEMFSGEVSRKHLLQTIFYSILIELCGIAHVYIAMYALNLPSSFEAAAVGYTISVVLMIISPFLRGLGAVEFTMIFIFEGYGYPHSSGLSITLLYRIFEFWLPLTAGLLAFTWRGRQLIARIVPAIAIFFLGIVNIISVITPPLAERIRLEKLYIPVEMLHASKLMVLILGIALIVTAAYLIKGMRVAWILALLFTFLSLVGNLAKALDYEEALLSLFILVLLSLSSKQYRIKTSTKWLRFGFTTFIVALSAVCIFEFLSFYLIDKHHFGIDFTWEQSVYHTARSFLLFTDDGLDPQTRFGKDFLHITRLLGFSSWLLLIYAVIKPRIMKIQTTSASEFERAKELLDEYGTSSVDYFKTTSDKQLFFSEGTDAFVSYRVANNFAVVLEEPVCATEDKVETLKEFEQHCKLHGLKAVYYRVNENSLYYFSSLKKQKMFIGQEAIMDVENFKLEGRQRKSLRNALNSLQKKGYNTEWQDPPHAEAFLNELQEVSDEWLDKFEKKEMVFSQGWLDKTALKTTPVIAVRDTDKKMQSFLNIIPDYVPEECTYDLIRRREEAPGGCMDAMIIRLWEYAKENKLKYLNLGMIPLSGNLTPDSPAERLLQFASSRVGSLKHYHSQRDFKEKYATIWENKYLVFGNDFDLLQLPGVLNKAMSPDS
jgi:phosphatidylglycerol lysyltransferase